MQESKHKHRLFWGLSLDAPWPFSHPEGRLIEENMRHVTLAFLGNIDPEPLMQKLDLMPSPSFKTGPAGKFEKLVFLPEHKPRVVAAKIHWLTYAEEIESFHAELQKWLEPLGFSKDPRPFLPHVTIARAPFDQKEWEEAFEPLPVIVTGITLYETIGNLHYKVVKNIPLTLPIEEFEHTADIAFHLRGRNYRELYIHGALALGFKFPEILTQLREEETCSRLDQVITKLNDMVTQCDMEMGCPFKAVSYHGKEKEENGILTWEMVVDV